MIIYGQPKVTQFKYYMITCGYDKDKTILHQNRQIIAIKRIYHKSLKYSSGMCDKMPLLMIMITQCI